MMLLPFVNKEADHVSHDSVCRKEQSRNDLANRDSPALIAAMAKNPSGATPRPRRAGHPAVRSALTGGYVLKPVSKGARVTLAQVRAAVKKLDKTQ